jgi:CDP-diacylglycerol--serine O-phosphatidyltransferase
VINIAGAYIAGFAMIWPEYLMALMLIYFSVGFGHGIINRNKIISSQKEAI